LPTARAFRVHPGSVAGKFDDQPKVTRDTYLRFSAALLIAGKVDASKLAASI
jgi:hypothetical protein